MQKSFSAKQNFTTTNDQQSLGSSAAELAKREGILEERERLLAEKLKNVDEKLEILEKVRKDLVSKLEKSSKMSAEEAQKILLENVEKDLASEISKKIKEAEEEIKIIADEKSKEILAEACLHGATNYVAEFTTSQVKLPDEEMKGRIIGKEGRNVRAFEAVTGVDILMDETPGVLFFLCSRIAIAPLEKLVKNKKAQTGDTITWLVATVVIVVVLAVSIFAFVWEFLGLALFAGVVIFGILALTPVQKAEKLKEQESLALESKLKKCC